MNNSGPGTSESRAQVVLDAHQSVLIDEDGRFQRYAGLHPYGDHRVDCAFFFGRAREAKSLDHRIRAERSLLFVGSSGIGKSSLLRAGVFPALRARQFFPFVIRLDSHVEDPAAAVVDALEYACRKDPNVDLAVLNGESFDPKEGLWQCFRSVDIWRYDGIMTPVLVFDQFEEVFTLHDSGFRRKLREQLRDLIETSPSRRRRWSSKRGNADTVPDSALDLRVVFSLREEYVADLEEFAESIPSLFDYRFRLLPMGRDNAIEAISKPAALDVETAKKRIKRFSAGRDIVSEYQIEKLFATSKSFAFTDGTADESDDAISKLLKTLVDRKDTIELTMLQTVCRDIEERVQKRNAPRGEKFVVNEKFLGDAENLRNVFRRHYRNALDVVLDRRSPEDWKTINTWGPHIERARGAWQCIRREILGALPRNQRTAARNLCERGLLTDEGMRISVAEVNAQKRHRVTKDTLRLLQRNRLLRKETRPNLDGFYYELSHDRLADVVFEERLDRRQSKHFRRTTTIALLVFVAALIYQRIELDSRSQRLDSQSQQLASAEQTLETLQANIRLIKEEAKLRPAEPIDEPDLRKPPHAPRIATMRDPFTDGSGEGPVIVRVPAGSFLMGSESGMRTDELPRHPVEFANGFHVTINEITLGEFKQFANSVSLSEQDWEDCAGLAAQGADSSNTSASWQAPGFPQGEQDPVVCVNLQDGGEYASWLSGKTGHCYRIPSEAEWEYVARAGTGTRFWWGDGIRADTANCLTCKVRWSGVSTAPVGSFDANAFGLHDTAGNAFEWVADCYSDNYVDAPADGSARISDLCDTGVVRGGAWFMAASAMRSAYRQPFKQSARSALIGMRLVREEGPCP